MSENKQEQEQKVETSVEQGQAPQQTKKERRQDQQKQQQQNQRGNESENQAPADLFAKSSKKDGQVEVKEDPTAVELIKSQIDEYIAKAGKGTGEGKEVEMATRGLHRAIRNLTKLRGQSLKQAFSYLYKAIKEDKTGSFKQPYPYRWGHAITGEQERKAYTSFMNLVLQYAKLQDPTYIHEKVDVQRSLAFIKDAEARADMLKQFASK